MTRKARRVLFYGLIALFLVVGSAVVLYAEGLRLDLTTGQVSKIGAIYVHSYPENASITLDGKPTENKSGFLSPGTLISDLFPKTYTVALSVPGFDSWHENVTVLPSFVAQFKYAVLVPQDATTTIPETMQRFFATEGFLLTENASNTISANEKPISTGTLLAATTDGHAFLFRNESGDLRVANAVTDTSIDLSTLLTKDGIDETSLQAVLLDPHDGSQIVLIDENKIWTLDLDQHALTLIEKTTAPLMFPFAAINDSVIAWTRFAAASDTSNIMLYDRSSGDVRESSTTLPGVTEQVAWIRDGQLGLVQSDGSLYLYDENSDSAQKIASDVKSFTASADGSMLAALEYSSTEIFTLNDPTGYYRFNLPDVGDIQQLLWYKDNTHLFVTYPDHVSFLDLQDADLANFTTVAQGTMPSYDQNSNILYFLNTTSHLTQLSFPN